MGIAKM